MHPIAFVNLKKQPKINIPRIGATIALCKLLLNTIRFPLMTASNMAKPVLKNPQMKTSDLVIKTLFVSENF